ncbi:MAG TPA: transcription termination/antitermination NusG family protein [Terriglobales bacterium]|nr:transcription termination/antitermination NusG family protein [Terriglobales bacterium]
MAEVDNAPAVRSDWLAVQTRPRHEKLVAEKLRMKSLSSYLPLRRCRHRWKNGVTADVELPFFPGYVFAQLGPEDRLRVLQTPGVLGFAASLHRPTPISNAEIMRLRTAIEEFRAEPHVFLNIGDRARIVAGPLFGMEGVLVRRKAGVGVVLNIELIMRSIVVEVSATDIEPILP